VITGSGRDLVIAGSIRFPQHGECGDRGAPITRAREGVSAGVRA